MEQKTFDPDGVGVDNGTYFGLPFEPETAELVIVSAPWDVTVSYGAGTAYAPDAIIEASTQLDFHEPLAPGAWRRGIATADVDYSLLDESQRLRGDAAKVIDHLEGGGSPEDDYVVRKICRVNEGCAAMNANIGAQAARWLDAGKLVGLVGGDHSTPYGLIRALGERHAEFGILHIDAHCDLRDAYEGFEFSHASIGVAQADTVFFPHIHHIGNCHNRRIIKCPCTETPMKLPIHVCILICSITKRFQIKWWCTHIINRL